MAGEEIVSQIMASNTAMLGFSALAIGVLILKLWAAWDAARDRRKVWYICLMVFNTLGILPAIYLIFFRRKK